MTFEDVSMNGTLHVIPSMLDSVDNTSEGSNEDTITTSTTIVNDDESEKKIEELNIKIKELSNKNDELTDKNSKNYRSDEIHTITISKSFHVTFS